MVMTRQFRLSKWGSALLGNIISERNVGVGLKTYTFGNSIVAGVNNIAFLDEASWQSAPYLIWMANEGIAGNTTEMMLARVVTDIPDTADLCLMLEGPNDAGAAVSVAQHYANFAAMIDSLLARNITPVLIATSPKDGAEATITSYHAAEYLCALDKGISIYDPWLDGVDTSDGGWIAGQTSDGTHPVLAQGRTAAGNLRDQIMKVAATPQFGPRSNAAGVAGYSLSGGNCFFLTDTNADGVADGWTNIGSTPATPSLISAPTGFRGQFQKLLGNSAGGYPYLRKQISASGNFGANDLLLISCAIETNVDISNKQAYFTVSVDGATTDIIKQGHVLNLAGQRFYKYIQPTTTTTIELRAAINNSASGQFIAFGELEVYNLTAMRALA